MEEKERAERIANLKAILTDPDAMRFFSEARLERMKLKLDLLEQGKDPEKIAQEALDAS